MDDIENIHSAICALNASLMEKCPNEAPTIVEALLMAVIANIRAMSMDHPETFSHNADLFLNQFAVLADLTEDQCDVLHTSETTH